MKIAFSNKTYTDCLPEGVKLYMPAIPDTYAPISERGCFEDLIMASTLIEDKGVKYFFLTIEVTFIRPILVDSVYKSIHEVDPDFEKKNLFVNASHTHIGPVYSKDQHSSNHNPGPKETEDVLMMDLIEHWSKLAGLMYTECKNKLTEFYADIAAPIMEGCFSSREGLDAPCDKTATVIRFFDKESSRQIGMWLNLSCHSVFHPEIGILGPDLIGAVARRLQNVYQVFAQPFAGCQGNVSTKHTGNRTHGIDDSIVEMWRVADEIVKQIVDKAKYSKIDADEINIHHIAISYSCDIDPSWTEKEFEEKSEELKQNNDGHLASYVKMLSQRRGLTCNCGEITADILHFGNLKMAMLNGELNDVTGPKLVRHEDNQHCIITCYVNSMTEYVLGSEARHNVWTTPAGLTDSLLRLVADDFDI